MTGSERELEPSSELSLRDAENHATMESDASSMINRYRRSSGRLRRRGMMISSTTLPKSTLAVHSIRRGGTEWARTIQPFVADLAFQSVVTMRSQSEITFRPYTCHAAILFVDISGYSKITAALAHRGAHFLSSAVNAYLERLLLIIHIHGGDVVKFAGDALLVVWEGEEIDLEKNVLVAAQCALALQEDAPDHVVLQGTDESPALVFHTHCGISCGILESEIFVAPTHEHMQRLFHSISGEPMVSIGHVVDIAKSGEVAVCHLSYGYLEGRGALRAVRGTDVAQILESLDVGVSWDELLEAHVEALIEKRMLSRNQSIEEEFIHQSVVKLLLHGGLSPTQIAQMRHLCVLFIAMTSTSGNSVNWLMEVQGVLDQNRCPIVQIIDDDKGVHVVAAVNLYETVPEASILGLLICRELENRQVGCATGMAIGTTFCGVTGSSTIACRWDITGPPAVRAARLMQFAQANNLGAAIDESVNMEQRTSPYLTLLRSDVELKGSVEPISVYVLSDGKVNAACFVMDTVLARSHDDIVAKIEEVISGSGQCCALVVEGPPLSGKKSVAKKAAGQAAYLHLSDTSSGLLQLARTIATWFMFSEKEVVEKAAQSVLDHMDNKRWSRAFDTCLFLANLAIEKGLSACFLVDRVQFLDGYSLSLIRELLHSEFKSRRLSLRSPASSVTNVVSGISENSDSTYGKLCFLCVHVSFYNWRTAEQIVDDITRSDVDIYAPIIKVGEASDADLRTAFRDTADMEVEDRWLRAYGEPCGHSVGYFLKRAAALRDLSGKLWKEGKTGFAVTTDELILHVPAGYIRKNKEMKVMQICPDVGMRFAQIYDELPPLFQTFCKILTVATRRGFFKVPITVVSQALNDVIADGVEDQLLHILLAEMKDMHLIKVGTGRSDAVVSFQSPALGDIAMDVCTPLQVSFISRTLIERLMPLAATSFQIPLVLADLHIQLGETAVSQTDLWRMSFELFLGESEGWETSERNRWLETIDDEIAGAGLQASIVLGERFAYPLVDKKSIGTRLPLLKIYSAPITLGPMGHSLSVICRNTFHEYRVFHGASEVDTAVLQAATTNAARRYLQEMDVVEAFLSTYDLGASPTHLERERDLIDRLSRPAESGEVVMEKAALILDIYVPEFVEHRRRRLHTMVNRLREGETPVCVSNAQRAIRRAYETLKSHHGCRSDAAQTALMIMASLNWKPRPVPEYLPIRHHQTVAQIRDKVLIRLSEAEAIVLVHQQTVDDFESFLIVTPLLYEADEKTR